MLSRLGKAAHLDSNNGQLSKAQSGPSSPSHCKSQLTAATSIFPPCLLQQWVADLSCISWCIRRGGSRLPCIHPTLPRDSRMFTETNVTLFRNLRSSLAVLNMMDYLVWCPRELMKECGIVAASAEQYLQPIHLCLRSLVRSLVLLKRKREREKRIWGIRLGGQLEWKVRRRDLCALG